MIEDFDPSYRDFFDEPDHLKRWDALKTLSRKDYWTFRVLFAVETLAIAETWEAPPPKVLKRLLSHQLEGGVLGARFEDLERFILPIWPLEMAKYDVLVYRTFVEQDRNAYKQYFFTSLKLHFAAIVQAWWAFETLMNDFAGIIKKARRDTLGHTDILMLDETAVSLDGKGTIQERSSYQPIDARMQFIFRLLTGKEIDRTSKIWHDLMALKNARDVQQHRIGKEGAPDALKLSKKTAVDGMLAVREVVGKVFETTPEFSKRLVYAYFRYWSCGMDSPFLWDGRCGNGFSLGTIHVDPAAVVAVYAPMPNSIGPEAAPVPTPKGKARKSKRRRAAKRRKKR